MLKEQVAASQLIGSNFQAKVVNKKVLPQDSGHRTLKTRGQVVNIGFRHATVAMLQIRTSISPCFPI